MLLDFSKKALQDLYKILQCFFCLDYDFQDWFPITPNCLDTSTFLFIKVEAQQISFFRLIRIHIFPELLSSSTVILFPMPNLTFYNILLSMKIYNDI